MRIKYILVAFGIIASLATLGIVCSVTNFACGAVNNATVVAKKEFYPEALLRKYEWFKDASAALDAKVSTVDIWDNKIARLRRDYGNLPRTAWARDDREQYAIWQSELDGIKASYNSLASEYNSQMSKFNWRFTNVGDLPPGATNPLPREYKPY